MEVDKPIERKCPLHVDICLHAFCCDCNRSLCSECPHNDTHRTVPLDKVFEKQKEIQYRIATIQKEIGSRLSEISSTGQNVKIAGANSLAEMRTFFDSLRRALDERERLLTDELTNSIEQRLASLTTEESALRRISNEIEQQESSLDSIPDLPGISSRLEEVDLFVEKSREQDNVNQPILHPTYFAQIEQLLSKMGTVLNISEAPTNVTASGEGLQYCCINRRGIVTVETKNNHGKHVSVEIAQVKGEILSQHGRVVCPVTVENTRQGVFVLFYELTREGLYQLSISVHGNAIPASPFEIRCISLDQYNMLNSQCALHTPVPGSSSGKRRAAHFSGGKMSSSGGSRHSHSHTPIDDDLILKVGEPGREKGQFTNIQGICCTANGHIIVADSNNQCVQIFTDDGQFTHSNTSCPSDLSDDLLSQGSQQKSFRFGTSNRSMGCLQRPTGVAVSPSGQILVADYDNKWINVYSSTGRFRSRFGSGRLLGPKGIAVTAQGTIIVVDNKAHSLLFFDSNGQFIKRMGSAARTAKFSFAGPHYVAIDEAERRIYVTDFHNHSVKVFSLEGRFIFQFGINGEAPGQFNAPTGIAVDKKQRVLVNDWGNGRIQVFDKTGQFIGMVNTNEQLYGPQGLCVTPDDGHVVVADTGNHCFKLYRYFV